MKFPFNMGKICTVHTDQKIAQEFYTVKLKVMSYVAPLKAKRSEVAMVDMDPRINMKYWMEPQSEIKQLSLGKQEG